MRTEACDDRWPVPISGGLTKPAARVVERLAKSGVLGGVPVSRFYPGRRDVADLMVVAATETNTDDDIEAFAVKLEGALR